MSRKRKQAKAAKIMKKYLILLLAFVMPFAEMSGKKKVKQNIQVWGEVKTGEDGFDYLTMYKNCPAEVTAQFHFVYYDDTESIIYDLVMPDSVAEVHDPDPVEKPVDAVVLDKIIYSTVQDDGEVYRTDDPDDPVLTMLLVDLFDFYHDLFWFDVTHRAQYYANKKYDNWEPSTNRREVQRQSKKKSSDLDLDKLDDTALLIGAAAVTVASIGMLFAVADNMDVEDERFPYFSISPQIQYHFQTGMIREVAQLKMRVGEYGGFSFMADLGRSSGSVNYPEIIKPGFTCSVGAGLDLGAFSLAFHFEPFFQSESDYLLSCQLGYDIFVSKHFAVDVRSGVGIFNYNDDLYAEVPLSVGLLWKF